MDVNVGVDDRGDGAHVLLRARIVLTPDSMPGVLPRASIGPDPPKPPRPLLMLQAVEFRLELLERGDELLRGVSLIVLRELIELSDPLTEMVSEVERDQESVDPHDRLLSADVIAKLTARTHGNQSRQQLPHIGGNPDPGRGIVTTTPQGAGDLAAVRDDLRSLRRARSQQRPAHVQQRGSDPRLERPGDDPRHDQVSVADRHTAWLGATFQQTMTPVRAAHGAHVTAVAVKQRQLRECRAIVDSRSLQRIHLAQCRGELTIAPDLRGAESRLTFFVVFVDTVMRRLQGQEGVHLEAQARMPGRHHAVRSEPIRRAVMTGQTELRPLPQVSGRVHAFCDVVAIGRSLRSMRRQPILRAPVAGLATHAVGKGKFLPALLWRDVIRMAVEAFPRLRGVADTELRGDLAGFERP